MYARVFEIFYLSCNIRDQRCDAHILIVLEKKLLFVLLSFGKIRRSTQGR